MLTVINKVSHSAVSLLPHLKQQRCNMLHVLCRSAIEDTVKLLQAAVNSKALLAQKSGQDSVAMWREEQTRQLVQSFRAHLQSSESFNLPLVRDTVGHIGSAQQNATQVLTLFVRPLPMTAAKMMYKCVLTRILDVCSRRYMSPA